MLAVAAADDDNDSYYFRHFRCPHYHSCMTATAAAVVVVVGDLPNSLVSSSQSKWLTSMTKRAMSRVRRRAVVAMEVYIYVTLSHSHLFHSHHRIHDHHLLDSDTYVCCVHIDYKCVHGG